MIPAAGAPGTAGSGFRVAREAADDVDPRWSDPAWERVPLDDGGPDDPGTFVPRLDPDDADDDLPPGVDEDDATGGFEDEYRTDQESWAEADDQPDYVYAGSNDDTDPPF